MKKIRFKGTTMYFSDVIAAISSLMSMLLMLFMAAIIIFVLKVNLDVNVTGYLIYDNPKADMTLLAYLDSTEDGYTMGQLLAYAVKRNSLDLTLGEHEYNVTALSKERMDRLMNGAYLLALDTGEQKTLASAGKVSSVENVRSETVVQAGGSSAKLILVRAK